MSSLVMWSLLSDSTYYAGKDAAVGIYLEGERDQADAILAR